MPGFSAATTSEQVPLPLRTQDLQSPVQADAQQKPIPGANVMHSFELQSPSTAQTPLVAFTQLPRPAQRPGAGQVARSVAGLVTPRQTPVAQLSHSPLHSSGQHRLSTQRAFAQSVLLLQVSPVAFLQPPSGPHVSLASGQSPASSVPAGKFSQRPVGLHLRQIPRHSDSQQTPSVH